MGDKDYFCKFEENEYILRKKSYKPTSHCYSTVSILLSPLLNFPELTSQRSNITTIKIDNLNNTTLNAIAIATPKRVFNIEFPTDRDMNNFLYIVGNIIWKENGHPLFIYKDQVRIAFINNQVFSELTIEKGLEFKISDAKNGDEVKNAGLKLIISDKGSLEYIKINKKVQLDFEKPLKPAKVQDDLSFEGSEENKISVKQKKKGKDTFFENEDMEMMDNDESIFQD